MDYNPQRVANILLGDFGLEGAIRYAERIARSGGPLSGEYAEALRILECRPRMCEVCGIYPGDPKTCAGCDAYAEHTSVY